MNKYKVHELNSNRSWVVMATSDAAAAKCVETLLRQEAADRLQDPLDMAPRDFRVDPYTGTRRAEIVEAR